MRKIIITLILAITFVVIANAQWWTAGISAINSQPSGYSPIRHADWHVSPLGDNSDGLTDSTAYNTFADLFANETIAANDTIVAERGFVYNETITQPVSGTSGNPIVYSAYGGGNNPVISGFTEITSGWTNEGGGIYSKVITSDYKAGVVLIDDTSHRMGRTPNLGSYNTYESYVAATSITDNQLTASPDWTGSDIVVRIEDWIWEVDSVVNHSTTTLSYSKPNDIQRNKSRSAYADGVNGYSYFFQNSLQTLDSYGEWYHDHASTGKLYVYFGSTDPDTKNVKVSTRSFNVDLNNKSYVKFENFDFTGAIADGIKSYGYIGYNLEVNNCGFYNIGENGIWLEGYINAKITNNTFSNISTGVYTNETGGDTIQYNTFSNVGLVQGRALNQWGRYCAIMLEQGVLGWQPQGCYIANNKFDYVGHMGVRFGGNNIEIVNNYFNRNCEILTDAGAIYTIGSSRTGRIIAGNVITNMQGSTNGTTHSTPPTSGIYLDEYATDVHVYDNTIEGAAEFGIKLHMARGDTIYNNTTFNCINGGIGFLNYLDANNLYGMNIYNNLFVSKESTHYSLFYVSLWSTKEIDYLGTLDNNTYSRPIDNGNLIKYNYTELNYYVDLSGWQTWSGKDASSTDPNYSVTTSDSIYFEYNGTSSGVAGQHHDFQVKDFEGNIYPAGNFWLEPYSSIIYVPNY